MGVLSRKGILSLALLGVATTTKAFLLSPPRTVTLETCNVHHLQSFMPPQSSTRLCASDEEDEDDNDFHPRDEAENTPQLLQGIWDQIARGNTMVKGEEATVVYPKMEDKLNDSKFFNILLGHLDACKDVCDNFGITTVLVPYRQDGKIVGFTVKSYKSKNKELDNFEFEYDPFWDDGTDFEELYGGIDDELEEEAKKTLRLPDIENKIPDDDDKILDITKVWVAKIMSDMGICPFTKGHEMAGLPMGPVFYTVDRGTTMEDMYASYWREVVRMDTEPDKTISTTLLIAPEFYIDNVELFESFSNTLTQSLAPLEVEDLLQLVFFHPQWSFRDGGARAGDGQAANYARRSPWPMINLLRTKQVRIAQKGIPTGLVYKQNEKTLGGVGAHKLETMLRLRDWEEIADVKVDRKEYDALRVAQDYQKSGKIKAEDQSLANDATPAANKVDADSLELGNLLNVLLDALRKRLGKLETGEPVVALTGPEVTATAMAIEFLMQELERIEETSPSRETVDAA